MPPHILVSLILLIGSLVLVVRSLKATRNRADRIARRSLPPPKAEEEPRNPWL